MKLFILVLFAPATLILAQGSKEDAINSIFGSGGFLADYEEVTPPPLKSIGALTKCGEGEQKNKFVCVPYYNCNSETNTVEEKPDLDGTNKIDIRLRDEDEDQHKCGHYLEICCKARDTGDDGGLDGRGDGSDDRNNGNDNTPNPGIRPTPTQPPPVTPSRPVTPPREDDTPTASGNNSRRAFCGTRNSKGLDFNLVGGTNEANFGEFPWMVAILRKDARAGTDMAICGGSLIGPNVVLTGAHCVQFINASQIKIRAGEWDTQTQNERIPHQERDVTRIIVHEHFIRMNLYNDVALLILSRPLTKTDSIGTACLPQQNQHFDSRNCFATGWGKNVFGQEGRYAVILKKLQLPLIQHQPCQTALRKTRLGNSFILHRSFLCAGGEPNLDTCTGDGGSPLVCPDPANPDRYLQVGIVAWGIGCGETQIPGVYVDIASFRNWIDLKLQEAGISTQPYTL